MDRLVPPATARRNSVHRRYKFFRRLLNFRQCDFQFALWQMLYLLISPNRVYRHAHYQKTHKNQYARDDPAFLVLLAGFLCLSSLMVAIVFGLSFGNFLALLLWIVFVDCIGTGCVIASTLWYVSNRFLRTRSPHTVEEAVEWAYCFDVHCNAFFPLLLVLHVLQILIIKIINTSYFVSTMAADTLWLVAVLYYVYITFVGYSGACLALPRMQPHARLS
mmetsp:Transcript_12108/g.36444  ORF Transcript_12108/g.36444 Transcript_12108/m.36444 type:complete len:219 (+) Transcript_12108:95-751(+)